MNARRPLGWLLLGLTLSLAGAAAESAPHRWRIMAVGDSITEGGGSFSCYRPLLAEKLQAAGVDFEFVGSRGNPPLRHEGYGGKNVEFLADTVPTNFAKAPADIILLHAGHNHFIEEKPVPGMVAATERLIAAFRATNPKVIVLLAQVIPAGKLPKYAYLPELNGELARLAARIHTPAQPVVLVDQASGFDWRTDTVADHVHPNAAGGAKMAQRWLEALQPIFAAERPGVVWNSRSADASGSIPRGIGKVARQVTPKSHRQNLSTNPKFPFNPPSISP